jgi:hypothetical protein
VSGYLRRHWLILTLCAAILGWFVCRAVAVHRDYAKRAVAPVAVTAPALSPVAMRALIESTAVWHGWHVVGSTVLLPRNGSGLMIHVEPCESAEVKP